MNKFVPYEKMSKKQKRALDREKRGTWQFSPVTRISERDKIHYTRKTAGRDPCRFLLIL